MPSRFERQYFDEIRTVWEAFSPLHNIIPFCTPVLKSPDALVIGMNHSDFVPNGGTESERISRELTRRVPTESTFLVHDHKFSQGIRGVCKLAGIELNEKWIGTNRCAVQTGPDGMAELRENKAYRSCQTRMDEILRKFVVEIKPKNVILVGKFAAELFYLGAESLTFENLPPRAEALDSHGSFAMLIPIMHVSRSTSHQAINASSGCRSA